MKAVFLLLCIFAVTCYGATSSLKFKLHNNVHQGEEEALLPSAPVHEEPVYSVGEPVYQEAAPAGVLEETPANEEPVYSVGEPVYQEALPAAAAPEETGEESVYATEEPVYSVGEPVYQEALPAAAAPEETGEESIYATEEPVYSVGEPVYEEAPPKTDEEAVYVVGEPEALSYAAPEEPVYTTAEPTYEEPVTIEEPEAVLTVDEPHITGGYADVDVSRLEEDQQLQAALDLGVDTLLQTAREDGKLPRSETAFRVTKVTRIQQQVVAGINYKFEVVLENQEDGRIYAEFTVYRGLDRTLTVQDGCLKVGRIIRY